MEGSLVIERGGVAGTEERPWPERLGELFDRHHGRLFRLALRLLADREEARDLVQDAFLRAARSPRAVPMDERGSEAWLVRTLVNLCRDAWRRRAVRGRGGFANESPATDAGASERALLARAAVRQALAALDPRRRAIVLLAELEGLTSQEIGTLLGLAAVTVRWHLARARRELAERLGGQVHD